MKSRLCVQMQFDVTLVIIKLLNSLMSGDVFNCSPHHTSADSDSYKLCFCGPCSVQHVS